MKLKGAFIGFGNIAENGHWPGYLEEKGIDLVAVADASAARRDAALRINPRWRVYATPEDLYKKEKLDFVDISTPPASHAPLARQALTHGLHVLVEKPLALNPEDFAALAKAATDKKRVLFTVHNWKYAPIFQKALDLLREQRIGRVWHAEVFTLRNSHCKGTLAGSPDWRRDPSVAGGGVLVDHGWHAFYLLLNLLQQDPKSLQASIRRGSAPATLEETAEVLVQFPEGDGYIHLTWNSEVRRNSMTVQGLEGFLVIDDDRILLTTGNGSQEEFRYPTPLSVGSHHADWFPALLRDFKGEIENPKKRGENLREASWCVALTQAAYQSAVKGLEPTDVHFDPTV